MIADIRAASCAGQHAHGAHKDFSRHETGHHPNGQLAIEPKRSEHGLKRIANLSSEASRLLRMRVAVHAGECAQPPHDNRDRQDGGAGIADKDVGAIPRDQRSISNAWASIGR